MKEKMYLFVESDSDAEDGMNFFLVANRHQYYTNDEQVNLETIEIEYDLPNNLTPEAIRLKAIETLRDKQQRVIAEAQQKKNELQLRIDEMLRLTHQPEVI